MCVFRSRGESGGGDRAEELLEGKHRKGEERREEGGIEARE